MSFTRPDLVMSYKDMMTRYLGVTTTLTPQQISDFLDQQIKTKLQKPSCQICGTLSYGNDKLMDTDLLTLISKASSKVVVPSGSIYNNSDIKKSMTTELVMDCKKERGTYKKLQFKAKIAGDLPEELKNYYAQTLVKINMNSLPGGYGSPFNLFYSKANYNAITSCARTEIRRAVTVTEQLLGGNFAWFNEQDLINHMLLLTKNCPSQDTIEAVITRHKMRWPSADELFRFYYETVRMYQVQEQLPIVRQLVYKQPRHIIAYLFYYMNLRHVLWYNTDIMKPYLERECDITNIDETKPVDPEIMTKIDGDFSAMMATLCSDVLNGVQLYDVPAKAPALVNKVRGIADKFQHMINDLSDIFTTFIDRDVGIPDIEAKPHMYRNCVVVSDTDSVVFTLKDWVMWYNQDLAVCPKAYQICGLVTYWLTKTNALILNNFARNQGVAKAFQDLIQMKNEFLYPRFVLYKVKKHYAGLKAIQEGVVIRVPEPDIKGGALKGSSVCRESNVFNQKFILNDILLPSMTGKLSARRLIIKTIERELLIMESIRRGETTYLKMASLKPKNGYKAAESSNYFYYMAWDEIFSAKYGEYMVPTKTAVCKINTPDASYLEWLRTTDEAIYSKFVAFYDKYERWPASIALNPSTNIIPKELIPLIDVREIVYLNMNPMYMTLDSLNIGVGYSKSRLMFHEVY